MTENINHYVQNSISACCQVSKETTVGFSHRLIEYYCDGNHHFCDGNHHFWIDFWKSLNQSFNIFDMLNFQIFSQKFDCFCFPWVFRTSDLVLLNYGPWSNKLTESRFKVPGSPIFWIVWKFADEIDSVSTRKASANGFADIQILGLCNINDNV